MKKPAAEPKSNFVVRWKFDDGDMTEDLLAHHRNLSEQKSKFIALLVARLENFRHHKGRGISEATRYLREQRLPGETAKALWERLKRLGESDGQPVYFDRVSDELVDRRTDESISFSAFEKRLIGSKKGQRAR